MKNLLHKEIKVGNAQNAVQRIRDILLNVIIVDILWFNQKFDSTGYDVKRWVTLKKNAKILVTLNKNQTKMKTHRLLLMAFMGLALSLVFTGCKKEDDEEQTNEIEKSYFTVENGNFENATFPAESESEQAPIINALNGNASVLEGGSNPLTIETTSSVKDVLIGVLGEKGYYYLPLESLKSVDAEILVILLFSQTFKTDSFVITLALRDNQGLVSVHETITVSRIEAGTGLLQVSCSWDRQNDVDLHLVEPSEEEIYYGMDQSENGGYLDVDSNAGCEIDNINNENITYSEESIVENGTYIVRVDLYSNCDVSSKTNFTVTAWYQGQLVSATSGSNPYNGYFNPEDEDYGEEGSGTQVMKFTISSAKDSQINAGYKFIYAKRNVVKSPDKVKAK